METQKLLALRPYQIEVVQEVEDAFYPSAPVVATNLPPGINSPEAGVPLKSLIIQCPTGGGKTVIASWIIRGALERGEKIMFLVHRDYLIHQTRMTLENMGITCGVVSAKEQNNMDADVMIMMVSSAKHINDFLASSSWRPTLIFIDEAHHSTAKSYFSRIQQFGDARLVGLSATPRRSKGNEFHKDAEGNEVASSHLGKLFQKVICTPPMGELVAKGYLAETEVFYAPLVSGDFSERGVWNGGIAGSERAKVVEHWQAQAQNRQTVCFAHDVEDAEQIAEEFLKAGVPARVMTGKTKQKTRQEIFHEFETKALRVIINVAVLTEGYDFFGVECVILASKTDSIIAYHQQVGRCLRPNPDGSKSLVIDLVGNVCRHGHHELPYDWTDLGCSTPMQRSAFSEVFGGGGGGGRKLPSVAEVKELLRVHIARDKAGIRASLEAAAKDLAFNSNYKAFLKLAWRGYEYYKADNLSKVELIALINYASQRRGKSPLVARFIVPVLEQSKNQSDFLAKQKESTANYHRQRGEQPPTAPKEVRKWLNARAVKLGMTKNNRKMFLQLVWDAMQQHRRGIISEEETHKFFRYASAMRGSDWVEVDALIPLSKSTTSATNFIAQASPLVRESRGVRNADANWISEHRYIDIRLDEGEVKPTNPIAKMPSSATLSPGYKGAVPPGYVAPEPYDPFSAGAVAEMRQEMQK